MSKSSWVEQQAQGVRVVPPGNCKGPGFLGWWEGHGRGGRELLSQEKARNGEVTLEVHHGWGGGSGAHREGERPRAASGGKAFSPGRERLGHGRAGSLLPAGGQGQAEATPPCTLVIPKPLVSSERACVGGHERGLSAECRAVRLGLGTAWAGSWRT